MLYNSLHEITKWYIYGLYGWTEEGDTVSAREGINDMLLDHCALWRSASPRVPYAPSHGTWRFTLYLCENTIWQHSWLMCLSGSKQTTQTTTALSRIVHCQWFSSSQAVKVCCWTEHGKSRACVCVVCSACWYVALQFFSMTCAWWVRVIYRFSCPSCFIFNISTRAQSWINRWAPEKVMTTASSAGCHSEGIT